MNINLLDKFKTKKNYKTNDKQYNINNALTDEKRFHKLFNEKMKGTGWELEQNNINDVTAIDFRLLKDNNPYATIDYQSTQKDFYIIDFLSSFKCGDHETLCIDVNDNNKNFLNDENFVLYKLGKPYDTELDYIVICNNNDINNIKYHLWNCANIRKHILNFNQSQIKERIFDITNISRYGKIRVNQKKDIQSHNDNFESAYISIKKEKLCELKKLSIYEKVNNIEDIVKCIEEWKNGNESIPSAKFTFL